MSWTRSYTVWRFATHVAIAVDAPAQDKWIARSVGYVLVQRRYSSSNEVVMGLSASSTQPVHIPGMDPFVLVVTVELEPLPEAVLV